MHAAGSFVCPQGEEFNAAPEEDEASEAVKECSVVWLHSPTWQGTLHKGL
jgi:hypothetical protein